MKMMTEKSWGLLMFKTDWIEFKHFDIIFISSFRHKTHPKSSVWNDVSGKELEVTHHHRKVQQGRRYMPTVMNGKTCRCKKKLFVTDWIQWKSEKKSDSSWNINRLIIKNGTTIQWWAVTRTIMVEVIIILFCCFSFGFVALCPCPKLFQTLSTSLWKWKESIYYIYALPKFTWPLLWSHE